LRRCALFIIAWVIELPVGDLIPHWDSSGELAFLIAIGLGEECRALRLGVSGLPWASIILDLKIFWAGCSWILLLRAEGDEAILFWVGMCIRHRLLLVCFTAM
jgi:hypothetical protein